MLQPTGEWKGGKGSGYTRVPQLWTVNRGSEAICQVMKFSSIRCLDAILPTLSRPSHLFIHAFIHSLNINCCCSVAQWCLDSLRPTDYSTPGFPALHHLPDMSLSKL